MVGLEHYLMVAAALLVPFAVQAEVTLSGNGRDTGPCGAMINCQTIRMDGGLLGLAVPPRLPVLGFGPTVKRAADFLWPNVVSEAVQNDQLPYDLGQLTPDGQGL